MESAPVVCAVSQKLGSAYCLTVIRSVMLGMFGDISWEPVVFPPQELPRCCSAHPTRILPAWQGHNVTSASGRQPVTLEMTD